ncbi:hypothetical protein FHS21_005739 [Phyllobacterium trifolii]|uniref:Uncharacterized protein n=1 Tax=Phyllobacterium trifolii TaxID=300193 RepID=A0A839UFF2_9HYPH|nr:hypothetical protein [Phyllobacterium trifolii]
MHVKSVESHYIRAMLTSRKVMQRKCIDRKRSCTKPCAPTDVAGQADSPGNLS